MHANSKLMLYDAVVLGLGGMGSAVIAHAAKRGMKMLGIEQFRRGHDRGSSSGRSRIIRQAYFENAAYVPLVRRAFGLWQDLERETQLDILRVTGVLLAAVPNDAALIHARASAILHDIAFDELSAADIIKRYPRLAPRRDEIAIFEPKAGFVVPEIAIEAYLRVAQAAGADMVFETAAVTWRNGADGTFVIELEDGSTCRTRRLALCMGPWFETIAKQLGIPLVVERRVQHWFAPTQEGYGPRDVPTFLISRAEQPSLLYGFPDVGDGVKAAFHGLGEATHPDDLDRAISAQDIEPVRAALEAWIPGAAQRYLGGKVCMYTLTPDEHFVLGAHPHDSRIVVAGGFSGHGFKFASAIGEIVADLLASGGTSSDIDFLSPLRFV